MCGCPAGCELARSSSTPSKAPRPSALASGAQRSCQLVAADADGNLASTEPTTTTPVAVMNVRRFISPPLPLLPDCDLVEVRATVRRGRGEPDQVRAGIEGRREGGHRPRVPVAGAGERRRGGEDPIHRDIHGTAG